jgi:hypothetical protein
MKFTGQKMHNKNFRFGFLLSVTLSSKTLKAVVLTYRKPPMTQQTKILVFAWQTFLESRL